MKRAGILAVGVIAASGLGGCAIPLQGTAPQASAEAVAACNQRADEQFLRQNRDALYKSDTYASNVRDSPFAGAGTQNQSQQLTDQDARNSDVRGCLNGSATPVQPAR